MADGSLIFDTLINTKGFEKGVSGLKKAGATAAKAIGVSMAAAGAAVAGVSTAFIKGASDVAVYGDNIDKMSQKLGMSAEAYQEWDAVLQHSGTSIEVMQASMKTLASAANTDSKAFEQLGFTQKELQKMSQEELFNETIKALQGVKNETERTYLAGKLLGRGATELGPLLNTSAEDVQKMKDEVHALGGVMSNEAVKASARFQDSLQDMTTSFSGFKRNLMSQFLPAIADAMDGISALMAGKNGAEEKLNTGIGNLTRAITKAIPKFFDLGGKVLGSFVDAIIANVPALIQTGTDVILNIVQGIVSALPKVANMAVQTIQTIAQSLADAFPQLLPEIVNGILTLYYILVDNLDVLIDAGVELVKAIAEGISNSMPIILRKTPLILKKIVKTFKENIPEILKVGSDILKSLIDGINEAVPTLLPVLLDFIDGFVEIIIDNIEPIIETGLYINKAIIDGIVKNLPTIMKKIPVIVEKIAQIITKNLPIILDAGTEILMALLDGIIDNLDLLVDLIPKIVETIVKLITDNVPMIAEAGSEIILGLVEGLLDEKTLQKLWEVVKELFKGTFKIMWASIKVTLEVGKKLIMLLWEGVKLSWGTVARWFGKLGTFIGESVKKGWNALVNVGKNLVTAIWDGIKQKWNDLKKFVSGVWGNLFGKSKVDVNVEADGSHASGLNYVPFDGYMAQLHKGEMVVPAAAARMLRANKSSGYFPTLTGEAGASGANSVTTNVTQNIFAEKQSPAQMLKEAIWQQERAVLLGV